MKRNDGGRLIMQEKERTREADGKLKKKSKK